MQLHPMQTPTSNQFSYIILKFFRIYAGLFGFQARHLFSDTCFARAEVMDG